MIEQYAAKHTLKIFKHSGAWFTGFLIMSFLYGCNDFSQQCVSDISIDMSDAKTLVVDDADVVLLDSCDEALIYDICGLEQIGDRYIIHSRNLLKAYDVATGKYLCDIARAGNESGNYSIISRMWAHNDTIRIFDANNGRINNYNSCGEYLGYIRPLYIEEDFSESNPKPSYVIETPGNDGFFVINTWMGGVGDPVPAYSFFTKEGRRVKNFDGRNLTCGGYLFDRAYSDKIGNRTLVWDAFADTLFNISSEGVAPLYRFDFGEFSFPEEMQGEPELSKRIEHFVKSDKRYVSMLGNYQVLGNRLYFSATDTGKHNYIIALDESTLRAQVYEIASVSGRYRASRFFRISNDSVIVALYDISNPANNPALTVIPINRLQ